MSNWSISGRLITILTVAFGGFWLLGVAASALVMRHEINEVFDSALQETAQRLLPLAAAQYVDFDDHDDGDDAHEIADMFLIAEHKEYLIYQVRNAIGTVLIRSHDAPHSPFPVPLQHGFFESDGQRFYSEVSRRGDLIIQIGEPIGHRTEAIVESLSWLSAPLLIFIPLSGLSIWLTVRTTLRPIGVVREEIGRRSGLHLAPISDTAMPAELAPVTQDINRLLERLSRALESERAFAANSAHELRTPIAAALAQTQRLSDLLSGSAHQSRANSIAMSLQDLSRLVEKLLQLSRLDAGLALTRERVDLLPVVKLLIDEYRHRPDSATRLQFVPPHDFELCACVDVDAFGIALRNILDNALTHGPQDAPINIVVTADKTISVVNPGPVVPPERLAKLTHRFERGATASRGFGLGLAIADMVMRQSGGCLQIYSPARGRDDGFEVVLCLD